MEHTLINIKTGMIEIIDDSTPEKRKEYVKRFLGTEWMEWFLSG